MLPLDASTYKRRHSPSCRLSVKMHKNIEAPNLNESLGFLLHPHIAKKKFYPYYLDSNTEKCGLKIQFLLKSGKEWRPQGNVT